MVDTQFLAFGALNPVQQSQTRINQQAANLPTGADSLESAVAQANIDSELSNSAETVVDNVQEVAPQISNLSKLRASLGDPRLSAETLEAIAAGKIAPEVREVESETGVEPAAPAASAEAQIKTINSIVDLGSGISQTSSSDSGSTPEGGVDVNA